MFKRLLTLLCLFSSLILTAQVTDIMNYRTIDGTSNNLLHIQFGAAGTPLNQVTSNGFSDGLGTLGGATRPNPRVVSNDLFAQDGALINDPTGMSDFTWVWGQFIDHDLGLTGDGPEPLIIAVPPGDIHFDPFGAGQAIIPMHRNAVAAGTGIGSNNPRRYINEITAFIDGSGVYGSDLSRANWLRSFEDGKLKVSAGNLMPYNTTTGEFEDPIDPNAPHMENATDISTKVFVAGDVRASENPLLASFHILFVREHNRQCDLLAQKHPEWNDEELYQHARKIVGGLIQAIVYEEWLPAMGVNLPPYLGYQSTLNPQLMNVFTAAAFRMGHTLLNSNIMRLDNNGEVIPQGNMSLRDAFFNPFAIQESGGIDPFLKGMGVQVQQEFDAKVIDDVRNFLFGQPGFGGLDLVSININRGRERGLADFNTIRADFGLPAYNFFQQINPDANVFTRLLSTYTDINDIDPWVGMLAERPMPGSIFGQTVQEIMVQQFRNLRDGDRFYYENDPILSAAEKQMIKQASLRDIIMYNTSISLMQDDVFGALAHEDICDNMTLSLGGLVRTFDGNPVPDVQMDLTGIGGLETQVTTTLGTYTFSSMLFCDLNLLLPQRDDNPVDGVTTLDIITIQKHILGVDPLDDPYQWIAADVNASNTVSTLDLIRIRKLILGLDTDFGTNTSWRFVLAAFEFPEDIDNPLTVDFPEFLDFQSEHAANYNSGFIAVKVGDVNRSINLSNTDTDSEKIVAATGLELTYKDQWLAAGEETTIALALTPQASLDGWQFELTSNALDFQTATADFESTYHHLTSDSWRVSYNSEAPTQESHHALLTVRAKEQGQLSQLLTLGDDVTAEAYKSKGTPVLSIDLSVSSGERDFTKAVASPNPFRTNTTLTFSQLQEGWAHLIIYGVDGKEVFRQKKWLIDGSQEWELQGALLPKAGSWRAQIVTSETIFNYNLIRQ